MIWRVVQVLIVLAVFVFNASFNEHPVPPGAAIITGIGLAFAITIIPLVLQDIWTGLSSLLRRRLGRNTLRPETTEQLIEIDDPRLR